MLEHILVAKSDSDLAGYALGSVGIQGLEPPGLAYGKPEDKRGMSENRSASGAGPPEGPTPFKVLRR